MVLVNGLPASSRVVMEVATREHGDVVSWSTSDYQLANILDALNYLAYLHQADMAGKDYKKVKLPKPVSRPKGKTQPQPMASGREVRDFLVNM